MSAQCGVCERPVGDGLRLCTACGATLVAALREIPELLAELDTARSGQARFAGERVGGKSAEVPLPIADVTRRSEHGVRLLGEREQHRVINAVTTWARDIAETLGHEIPFGTMSRFIDWLIRREHEMRGHVAAEELHSDILGGVIALRRVIDRPVDRKFVGRCPQDGANLWAEIGESWVRCRTCREQHSVRDLEDQAAEAAREMLCTMPELLRACSAIGRPIAKRTGYYWAQHGRLTVRGWMTRDERGERITDRHSDGAVPVYRVGDALELASLKGTG